MSNEIEAKRLRPDELEQITGWVRWIPQDTVIPIYVRDLLGHIKALEQESTVTK
jgi:hypothetical protein